MKQLRRTKRAFGPLWWQFNDQQAFTELWKRFMRAKEQSSRVLLGGGKHTYRTPPHVYTNP